MLRQRRRHINGDPGGRAKGIASGVADLARWPFERAAWSVERRALWPLQRRLAGWAPPGRRIGAAAGLAAIGVAAILAAVLILPGGSEAPAERVAQPARVAILPPGDPQQESVTRRPDKTLQGAQPHFGVEKGVAEPAEGGASAASSGDAGSGSSNASSAGSDASPAAQGGSAGGGAAASASATRKPVPAGPAAMKVARRFAEAFVYYEIGKRPARAKTVFGETASPRLAAALGERQPRLPAGGKVPKAKVLNLVPGPRAGKAYTVSASLLRVGLTSELRLELIKQKGQWLVTDVRG